MEDTHQETDRTLLWRTVASALYHQQVGMPPSYIDRTEADQLAGHVVTEVLRFYKVTERR